MTYIGYTNCDCCGHRDDVTNNVFHLALADVNGAVVGHLCVKCARAAAPLADWSPFDRSA